MYFYSYLAVEYEQARQALKFVEWDVKTITAGDYTFEFELSPLMYDNFLKDYYDPSNPLSELA